MGKKYIIKNLKTKKITLFTLFFIGLSCFQFKAQTILTLTDVSEVQNFTSGTNGDLTKNDVAITSGEGTLADKTGYIRVINSSSDSPSTFSSTLTFKLKSTNTDLNTSITFKLKKRLGNSLVGNVTVGGTQTNVTVDSASSSSETFSVNSTGDTVTGFGDVELHLDPITITTSEQTIVLTITELDQGSVASGSPQLRIFDIDVDKTIISGCTEATNVTSEVANPSAESVNLNWTNSTCYEEVLIIAKENSSVTAAPTGDGTAYSADVTFGSGDEIATDEFIVYKGTEENTNVTGLTKETTYYFKIFTRKGSDWSDGVSINATTNNEYVSITGAANSNLNWEDSSSWISGAIPSEATDDVIINTGLIINENLEFNNVVNNARITINAGYSLTAADLSMSDGKVLIVKATYSTFGSLIVENMSSSTTGLIYDRPIPNTPINDHVSSPVSGMVFSSFAINSQNENRLYINPNDANEYLVGPFDNTSGTYDNYSVGTDDDAVFNSGVGFRIGTIADNPEENTIRFQGAVPMGDISISLSDETTTNTTSGKWNLIGNPYPSYIDFETFYNTNKTQFDQDEYQAVYGYAGVDADNNPIWTIWNQLTIDDTNITEKIAPSQGFFVASKSGGSTQDISFTPAMRSNGTEDNFMSGGNPSLESIALAKITMDNGNSLYNTDIYFEENQTKGLDSGYDAGAFSGSANGIFTNLVEQNTGVAFAIQALPYNDISDITVPVAINSEAGEQLTISLDIPSLTLPTGTYVYLKDNLLDTLTLLNEGDYVFTPDSDLNGAGRFFIQFSSSSVLSSENYTLNEILIYTNQQSKSIIIEGILKTKTYVKVYDIQGRIVMGEKLDNSRVINSINASKLNSGIYIIQLEGLTQKIILE
jgi:hypothetical protein